MAICEADPWRQQYFEGIPCPPDVQIPTEDADAWVWFPRYRWIYNKLAIAHSQGIAAAPHGVTPPGFPVFSKPLVNLRGMGVDSRVIESAADYHASLTAGHFWMELLHGEHVSTDVAVEDGRAVWWRHATGVTRPGGTFDRWVLHAEHKPDLEAGCGDWIAANLAGYTGMLNLETIAGRIIEAHLRFADQWPDLNGPRWVEAVIELYATGRWNYADDERRTGYSVVLFAPSGPRYQHPPAALLARLRAAAGISSVQVTFHADRDPGHHPMPPGGFRLAIVNCHDLAAGRAGRAALREAMVGTAAPDDDADADAADHDTPHAGASHAGASHAGASHAAASHAGAAHIANQHR